VEYIEELISTTFIYFLLRISLKIFKVYIFVLMKA
jgi:hypothetical protein